MAQVTKFRNLNKILVSNRGEIACRVIKTARRMNIKTVAVFSDTDRHSLHVKMADEAHHIGESPASESYLRQDKILEVIKKTGAQAVHPGYGFLSEQPRFADLLESQGVVFIGPPSSAIADMGSKSASKKIMIDAGVSCIPGYHGDNQDEGFLKEQAAIIGYPLIIKAVSGGGGKGMRTVFEPDNFISALHSAKEESIKSFNDDRVILERFFDFKPRHVEVQIMADAYGDALYFSERDCSVQRRHQKIIEEAPAPGLSPEESKYIGEMAVKAAKTVGYRGAGTVEFIMDTVKREFYFMEMNTRLQVEHPVTEFVTGVDLVELQIRVARGEPLPITQEQVNVNGWSFEARIYAEDPSNSFMPGSGDIRYLSTPTETENVRIDTSIRQGDAVSVFYDPMIAKLVVWGPNRTAALALLHSKLQEYHVVGLTTNIPFLKDLATHPEFDAGNVHTDFIPEHNKTLFAEALSMPKPDLALTAVAYLKSKIPQPQSSSLSTFPFFRLNMDHVEEFTLHEGSREMDIKIRCCKDAYHVSINGGQEIAVEADIEINGNVFSATGYLNNQKMSCKIVHDGEMLHVYTNDGQYMLEIPTPQYLKEADDAKEDDGVAAVEGIVQKIFAKEGDEVKRGDIVVQINVMKMLFDIVAQKDGIISAVCFQEGDRVSKGELLFELKD